MKRFTDINLTLSIFPDDISEKLTLDYICEKYPKHIDISFWSRKDLVRYEIGYSYRLDSFKYIQHTLMETNRIPFSLIREWVISNRDKKIDLIIN